MAIVRYVHVGLSLDPRVEIVTPCDEFNVGEDEDIQVFLGSELWAYYPAAIYTYLEEVDEPEPKDSVDDSADDEESEAQTPVESVSVLASAEVDGTPKPSNGSSTTGSDEAVSGLLN